MADSSTITSPDDLDSTTGDAGEAQAAPSDGPRDVNDVGADVARDAWAEAARTVLLGVAGNYHAVISHVALSTEIQRTTRIHTAQRPQHWLGDVLLRVATDSQTREEPNLAALCVDGKGSVGKAYADAVYKTTGTRPADPDGHAADERLACYKHAEASGLPDDGGVAALSPLLETSRDRARTLARKHAKEARTAPVCPVCFIEIPVTGECDNCA